VEALAVAALHQLKWSQFVGGDNASVAWDRVVVSGHSQGASHAAYLSVTRKTRAAVLLSGPQECPDCAKGWLRGGPPTLRRAAYSLREECGDLPYNRESYCAKLHPGLQKRNLEAMGLAPGLLGNESGYVVVDFAPLELGKGRPHHDSVALGAQAPAGVVALWKTLFAAL
jgi:pimeloyl-ACP methyl ester carboxylesterase